jgi:hypothetical protein
VTDHAKLTTDRDTLCRHVKTGKLVLATLGLGVVYYYSERDGQAYGPVRGLSLTRFNELYREAK